jgi:hypothetical protein
MTEARDRFLAEAMGGCWHDIDMDRPVLTCKGGGFVCKRCGEFVVSNSCFSTEEDFALLRAWAHDHERANPALARILAATPDPCTKEQRDSAADAIYHLLRGGAP